MVLNNTDKNIQNVGYYQKHTNSLMHYFMMKQQVMKHYIVLKYQKEDLLIMWMMIMKSLHIEAVQKIIIKNEEIHSFFVKKVTKKTRLF